MVKTQDVPALVLDGVVDISSDQSRKLLISLTVILHTASMKGKLVCCRRVRECRPRVNSAASHQPVASRNLLRFVIEVTVWIRDAFGVWVPSPGA